MSTWIIVLQMGCAVYGCNNSYHKKKRSGEDLVFHRFPKGIGMETVRKVWITCCNRDKIYNINSSYICSVHFTEDDYERDLKNELLGLPVRKILKKTAVPTCYSPKPLGLKICTYENKRGNNELDLCKSDINMEMNINVIEKSRYIGDP
ncbi:THAP domain-containing protein 1-like [Cylas formicarius]|uniref:THAP domain-containing protein 1-like n=1 Tax=Cylas formicarius TaxID=197179 RepID=UPI0029586E40|nr:THAP domain-containing protein 1-like [Cylas formicarius]